MKVEFRAMTESQRSLESPVMMSSTIPSAKYSWSWSSLRLTKGSTANEGRLRVSTYRRWVRLHSLGRSYRGRSCRRNDTPPVGSVAIHSPPSGVMRPRCFLSDAIWTERFVSSTAAPCQAASKERGLGEHLARAAQKRCQQQERAIADGNRYSLGAKGFRPRD